MIKQGYNTILSRMSCTSFADVSDATRFQVVRVPDIVRTIIALEDIDKPTHERSFDRLRAFDAFA